MYREKWEPGIVHCGLPVYFVIMIMMEVTRKGRACIPEHCAKKPKMFKSKCLKSKQKKKNSMTGPGQPQTCSHMIYTQTLTGVCQVVRYFLLAIFMYLSIGYFMWLHLKIYQNIKILLLHHSIILNEQLFFFLRVIISAVAATFKRRKMVLNWIGSNH